MTARRSSRNQAGQRLKDATVAFGRKCKSAVQLNPEQRKVFAVTLVTALVGGGGLGSLVDLMQGNQIDAQGTNIVSMVESNATYFQEASSALQAQLQQTQEALQAQIAAQEAHVAAIEKEPLTIRQEFEALKGEIAGFQSSWEKKADHEHKYGDWGDPEQIQGNFVTPQFFQYRKCLICGQADARSTW